MTATIDRNDLLSLWNLEAIPACDEGMRLAEAFLEAASDCVNLVGKNRTSGTRLALLAAYNWMEAHGNTCDKCNEVSALI